MDSHRAGREAAQQALQALQGSNDLKLSLVFASSKHDADAIRVGIREVLGHKPLLIGGYAVGIITRDHLGYDGYQVGVALVQSTLCDFTALIATGLDAGEAAVGRDLGARLLHEGYADRSLLLLYDAVDRTRGLLELNMATPLLAGLEEGLGGQLPNIAGLGLVGDMRCQPTYQWFEDRIEQQAAIVLPMPSPLSMNVTVMHGCKPASDYHTVTAAEGNTLLEIDHRPALDVIDELLGSDQRRSWRDYAFFVTLGVNQGDKWGEFKEQDYVNRLCVRADPKRRALIMFEPDLLAGTEVQLMHRDIDLTQIRRQVHHALSELESPPFLALYIDCAGRASGYSGTSTEDATAVQEALGDIPLLGLYSGVEIASVGGRPRPLDWTGVLVLLSLNRKGTAPS